jgi:selT/selW/selH-like putative selenoprotein
LADELNEAFGVESMLTAGSNGIFEVIVDGNLVFSRQETGRFPQPGEIVQKLKA